MNPGDRVGIGLPSERSRLPLCPGLSPQLPGVLDVTERGGRWQRAHGTSRWASPVYFPADEGWQQLPAAPPRGPSPRTPQSACTPTPPCWAQPRPRSTISGLGPADPSQQAAGCEACDLELAPGVWEDRKPSLTGGAGGQPAHGRMVCAQEAVGEGEGWASPREPASAGQLPWGLRPWPPAAPQGSGPGRPCARGALGRQDGHMPTAVTSFKSAPSPSVPPSRTGASSPVAGGGPGAVPPTPHRLSGARPHGWRAPGPHTRRRTFSCSGSCTWAVCLWGWGCGPQPQHQSPRSRGAPAPSTTPHQNTPGLRVRELQPLVGDRQCQPGVGVPREAREGAALQGPRGCGPWTH